MDKEQVAAQDMVETVAEVDATGPTLVAESGDKAAESSGVTFDLATGEADIVPVYTDAGERVVQDEERYEAGPVLGAGGMGEVRLTRDARIGRHVAVKRLLEPLSGEATRRRFLREARIQGQLEHPAVVPVYDLDFDEQGQPFFTMKRVRGQTLSRILELSARGDTETRERFGRRRLLAAFTQACHAVHYAHVRGVVHRDLKPSNIMIGDYGEVYVLDWGVARVDKDASDEEAGGAVLDFAEFATVRGTAGGGPGIPGFVGAAAMKSAMKRRSCLTGRRGADEVSTRWMYGPMAALRLA